MYASRRGTTVVRFRSPTQPPSGADAPASRPCGTTIEPAGSPMGIDFLSLPPGEMVRPMLLEAIVVGTAYARPYRLDWRAAGERPRTVVMAPGFCNVTAAGHESRLSWPQGADVALIRIDPAYVAETIGIAPERFEVRTATGSPSEIVRALVVAWRERLRSGRIGSWHAEALAYRLALHLATTHAGRPTTVQDRGPLDMRRLTRVLEYVDAHLAADLRLRDMAAIAGLARCHFVGSFRRATGVTPYAYVRRARLRLAREELRRPGRAVADVARMVGFIGPSHFANAFRLEFGVSPRAWRASQIDDGVDAAVRP